MSDEQPQTEVKDASARITPAVTSTILARAEKAIESATSAFNLLVHNVADLERRNINQRAAIEKQFKEINDCKGRILELEQQVDPTEPSTELLKNRLERALHTQKILERDLEEYQQAYADLKASVFSDDDRTLPPRLLEFGHGEYLVYPAKVYLEDDDQDPKWGIVIDPTTDVDVEEYLKPLAGKDVVLTDGDVAITFEKPADVARLIQTLEDLCYRWFAGIFDVQEK